jgi:hypothetical protein
MARTPRRITNRAKRLLLVPTALVLLVAAGCVQPPKAAAPSGGVAPAAVRRNPVASPALPPPVVPGGVAFGFAEFYKPFWQLGSFAQDAPVMAAAGAKWVRMDCDWSGTEPARGVYNWSRLDQAVAVASQYGLKTLCALDFGAGWDGSCPDTCKHLPVHPAYFAEFAAAVTARYPRSVMPALEVWNEPNLLGFAGPVERGNNYAALLQAVYPAVKAVDPNMTVLAGALAQQGSDSGSGTTPSTFLSTVYASGGRGFFDAVSLHPYGVPGLAYALGQLDAMHSIMAAHGDGAKMVWSTEAGESTCGVSEATQAQTYQDYVTNWESHTRPWLGPLFFHTLHNRMDTSDCNEHNFGILRDDGSPKPAYTTLQNDLT